MDGSLPTDRSTVRVSARAAGRVLTLCSAVIVAAGLAVEIAKASMGLSNHSGPVAYLSLSYEANVPTFYSAALLLACSLLLAVCASAALSHSRGWWLLCAGFLYMALDESVEIHEHLGFLHTTGVLTFSWIVPAAVVVVCVFALLVPLLRALAPSTRRRFLLAGAIYVSGALLFELPLGWWTSAHGTDNLGYALIDWVEETLEIAGVQLFLLALLDHIAGQRIAVTVGAR